MQNDPVMPKIHQNINSHRKGWTNSIFQHILYTIMIANF